MSAEDTSGDDVLTWREPIRVWRNASSLARAAFIMNVLCDALIVFAASNMALIMYNVVALFLSIHLLEYELMLLLASIPTVGMWIWAYAVLVRDANYDKVEGIHRVDS